MHAKNGEDCAPFFLHKKWRIGCFPPKVRMGAPQHPSLFVYYINSYKPYIRYPPGFFLMVLAPAFVRIKVGGSGLVAKAGL